MTQEQLLKYINDNPEHPLTVELDNDGQVVVFTGLRIGDEGFEPIDYYNTEDEMYRIDDAFGVVYKWDPQLNAYLYHCRKENFRGGQ